MNKKALVFNFFPATYDTETGEVTVTKSWQNGEILSACVFLMKCFNWFYVPLSGGDSLKFNIWVDGDEKDNS